MGSMALYRSSFVRRYVFISFIISTTSEICQASLFHRETILCPPTSREYPQQACSTSTNCRFGGECRQAADFSDGGEVTRYVIPKESNDHRPVSGDVGTGYWPSRHSGSGGDELCTCPFICDTQKSIPVCGTNEITYTSKCHLQRYSCRCQADVKIKHSGPCIGDTHVEIDVDLHQEQAVVPRMKMPMSNCAERCQFGGRCDDEGRCQCNIYCQDAESFVCGRDGKTYKNSCSLRLAQCEEQRGITIFHDGRCRHKEKYRRGVPPCLHRCDSKRKDPICGSDGVTYLNECVLKHASCKSGEQINVAHLGVCGEQPLVQPTQDPCREIYCEFGAVCVPDPEIEFVCSCNAICSEDTMQTDNNVRLSVASSPRRNSKWIDSNFGGPKRGKKRRGNKGRKRKNHKRRRHRTRSKRSIDGSRAPRNVTLCGSDGKTYKNLCEMKTYACHEQTNITMKHVGACPMVLPTHSKQAVSSKLPDIVEVPSDDIVIKESMLPYPRKGQKAGRHPSKARKIDVTQALEQEPQPTTSHKIMLTSTVVYPTIPNEAGLIVISNRSEPATNKELEDGAKTNFVESELGRSASNPTVTWNIDARQATSGVDTSGSTRSVMIEALVSNITVSKDSNPSQGRNNSEIGDRLVAVTVNSSGSERKRGFIRKLNIRQDLHKNNLAPCEYKDAESLSLKWYHVALISVVTQILVVAVLIGICVLWKKRHNSKLTDSFTNTINETEKNPKDEQSAGSEKT